MNPNHHPEGGRRVSPRAPGGTPAGRSRAHRTRVLRRRVISGALAVFVASWLLIAVVLASGHDPALAARKTAAASISSNQTTGTTGTSGSTTTTTTTTTPTTTPTTTRQS